MSLKIVLLALLLTVQAYSGLPDVINNRRCADTNVWSNKKNPTVFIVIDCNGTVWWIKCIKEKIVQEQEIFCATDITYAEETVRKTLSPYPFEEEQ